MLNKFNKIKLIVTDFDGILTDGGVYLSSISDEEVKKVSFKDIMGLSLAVKNGLTVGIISGEDSPIIDNISRRFKLEDVHKGIKHKALALNEIIEKYNLKPENVCYLGDDINDISALEVAGVAVTVPGANYKVQKLEGIYITNAQAGDGAFREVIDLILDN
ncbi:MAG: HAD family hydrolase [bacterium]